MSKKKQTFFAQVLKCQGCDTSFVYTEREQAIRKQQGMAPPERCGACRGPDNPTEGVRLVGDTVRLRLIRHWTHFL